MAFYLRYNGKTLVDIEASHGDLSSVVVINVYSDFLFNSGFNSTEIVNDFHDIQELRGEFWEKPVPNETPVELTSRRLHEIADKYNLQYVTD